MCSIISGNKNLYTPPSAGDALESPAPSPQHGSSADDMHSRLELYASRLAQVELGARPADTPDRYTETDKQTDRQAGYSDGVMLKDAIKQYTRKV